MTEDYYYYPNPNDPKKFEYCWDRIDPIIKSDIERTPYKMTVRDHFYSLGDRGMLPNLQKTYKAFDKHVTTLRENGTLPTDCYSDAGHPVTEIKDEYYSPDDWIETYGNRLWNIGHDYLDEKQNFPRWHAQNNHVELWTEKEAMINTIGYYVQKNDLQVKIVSFGGFRGFSWFNEQINRLKQKIKQGKNIHILYLGDFDPSGECMDDVFVKSMHLNGEFCKVFGWDLKAFANHVNAESYSNNLNYDITFERIAVTKGQIEQYDLPWNPSKMSDEVQDKLENDKRTVGFKLKYGKVFATEVSALSGAYPQIFEKVITESVNQYFDHDIYKEGLEQHEENYSLDYIKEQRNNKINTLVTLMKEEQEDGDKDETDNQ